MQNTSHGTQPRKGHRNPHMVISDRRHSIPCLFGRQSCHNIRDHRPPGSIWNVFPNPHPCNDCYQKEVRIRHQEYLGSLQRLSPSSMPGRKWCAARLKLNPSRALLDTLPSESNTDMCTFSTRIHFLRLSKQLLSSNKRSRRHTAWLSQRAATAC